MQGYNAREMDMEGLLEEAMQNQGNEEYGNERYDSVPSEEEKTPDQVPAGKNDFLYNDDEVIDIGEAD